MKILLADDNRLLLEGLTSLLEAYGHEVVATAVDGFEAVARTRVHRPDIVLMDVRMPRCDGLAATRSIVTERPETRIVMLTTSDEDEHLFAAIAAGACGYLLKSVSGEELIEALAQAADGIPPFSPGLAARLLAEFARRATPAHAARGLPPNAVSAPALAPSNEPPAAPQLTERETEVLRSVAAGRTYKETAAALGMSERTVRYHMGEMLARLHLEHRSQAIAFAAGSGLLDAKD